MRHRVQIDSSQRVEVLGGWVKKVKGLSKKKKENKTHRHRQQQYGDYQKDRGWREGEVEKDKGRINGDRRRFDFWW